jgi:hypothetical protein
VRRLWLCCACAALAALVVPASSLSESAAAAEPPDDPVAESSVAASVPADVSPEVLGTCDTTPDFSLAARQRQCGGGSTRARGARDETSKLSLVKPSVPGEWRRNLKLEPSKLRAGGGPVDSPEGPVPYEVDTKGRWIEGYRPGTAEAQREFERWKREQRRRQVGPVGVEPTAPAGSALGDSGTTGTSRAEEEASPIVHTVREETYPASKIDLRRPLATVPTPAKTKVPSDYNSSGLLVSEYLQLKEMAELTPPTMDGQEATQNLMRAPTASGVSFDALGAFGTVPPDPIMAVGPNHLVAIVNNHYRVWDKSGTPLTSTITLSTFFQGVTGCVGTQIFDPYIDYDEANDRFVMGAETIFASGDSYLCVAATATNDPTGVWNRFGVLSDAMVPADHIDYPHMGIGLDAVYISGNMFVDGGGFSHIRLFALDKDDLYNGTPLTVAEADMGFQFITAQPAKLHGFSSGGWPAPGTPHHIITHNRSGTTRIWRWINPFSQAPTTYGTLSEINGGFPPLAPESGGGTQNDTGDTRYFDAEYRDGKLWATRNVGCNFGGGLGESCVDWVVFDVSGPVPVLLDQQSGGAYGSTDDFRYYPDISVDRNNNIAIGYTKSSNTTFTEVWVTGRESSDAPSTLQPEIQVRAGLGNYTDGAGCGGACDRWGDYTGMTIDPAGCTFWYIGQFSDGGGGNWDTRIANFKFDSCSVDSAIGTDKGFYTCADTLTVTVTDNTRITADTVSAQTLVTSWDMAEVQVDSETILAGDWSGTDCVGAACGSWTAVLPVSGDTGSNDDGTINAADGGFVRTAYTDPHAGHMDQSREATVTCQTRLDDAGFTIDGGCELATGPELYRDYLDGGEYLAYTFALDNPASAPPLTDVLATLSVSGPAADKVTIFNPTVQIGPIGQSDLGAAVFNLFVDPSVDSAAFRMSEHDFNLSVTSAADGYTVPQLLTQKQLIQADDNIVGESECFNFETIEGFRTDRYVFSYSGGAGTVNTVQAPWTRGGGCLSETRTDHPMSCDVGGANAYKSNSGSGCADFAQSPTQLTDDLLYTPIFGPVHTGNAANGQPWNFAWLTAEWFYFSDMVTSTSENAAQTGHFFDHDYEGTTVPAENEIDSLFPLFTGYFTYPNQVWDSAKAWDPNDPPANYDSVSFSSTNGEATVDRQWRWAIELYDIDFGDTPTITAATAGLAIDNLNLIYDQYHAIEQVGTCDAAVGTVSFDKLVYRSCGSGTLALAVLDGDAPGPVTITVTSDDTGDSETLILAGPGPYFTMDLTYDTAGGAGADDGTLFVTPADSVNVSYDDTSPVGESTSVAFIECQGGAVQLDGVVAFQDNGDGDRFADTNETVDLSLQIRNNTGQPLTNTTAMIVTDSPHIECMINDTAGFGTIAADGGTAANDLATDAFSFKIANTTECTNPDVPPTVTFTVFILADGFDGAAIAQRLTLQLDLNATGAPITLVEDFDVQPADFVHELGPGDVEGISNGAGTGLSCTPNLDEYFWRGTGGNPGGAFFCWTDQLADFPTSGYSDLLDSVLLSPTLIIGATSTTLSFDHEYKFADAQGLRADGAIVEYSVNGSAWQKMTGLPYDGPLIHNTYCNPLCNGGDIPPALPCFSENAGNGENIFNRLDDATVNWTTVSSDVTGLTSGDQLQFRWRVGSMNSSAFSVLNPTGGYGVDNVSITNVVPLTCDTAANPDVGCGVVFGGAGNLVQVCGNDNAVVEPSEVWAVDVTLKNVGSSSAVDTMADLAINAGSTVNASVTGNPASYGTIVADGGTSTATYEFQVEDLAICLDDIVFDVTNMTDLSQSHPDKLQAFAVDVGGINGEETATQALDPISATDGSTSSNLSPAFSVMTPIDSGTLSYSFDYVNSTPSETASQDTNPLVASGDATVDTTLSPAFTIATGDATSATVNWSGLSWAGGQNLTKCVRVFLQTPNGTIVDLKEFDVAPNAPYDVLLDYQGANGGPGAYRIGLQDRQGGGCNGTATLTSTTMTVVGSTSTGDWMTNAQVSLFDGTTSHVLKAFGVLDPSSYDVTSIYNAAGPGTYQITVEEASGGGTAEVTSASMSVVDEQCELGCTGFTPAPPPVADGVTGSFMTVDRGAGPDELIFNIDNLTCADDHAVVLYGNLGDFTGYQGAVDVGCDIGSGQSTSVTHTGSNVWFNVIWVNVDDAGGSPGFETGGARGWTATGLCGVTADDPSDNVCN